MASIYYLQLQPNPLFLFRWNSVSYLIYKIHLRKYKEDEQRVAGSGVLWEWSTISSRTRMVVHNFTAKVDLCLILNLLYLWSCKAWPLLPLRLPLTPLSVDSLRSILVFLFPLKGKLLLNKGGPLAFLLFKLLLVLYMAASFPVFRYCSAP